ncbi:hypothetical protein ACJJTC_014394 [Scirpophaga incertulas]
MVQWNSARAETLDVDQGKPLMLLGMLRHPSLLKRVTYTFRNTVNTFTLLSTPTNIILRRKAVYLANLAPHTPRVRNSWPLMLRAFSAPELTHPSTIRRHYAADTLKNQAKSRV